MNIDSLKHQIRYITDEQGKKTDVLIPFATWENILNALSLEASEYNDSQAEILADLKQSLLDAQQGKTFPLEELWDGIES